MDNREQLSQSIDQKPKSNTWATGAVVIITALIVGGGVYFWQKADNAAIEKNLHNKISSLEEQISETETLSDYKEFQSVSLISFEVPKTWSILTVPERIGIDKLMDLPTISVGQEDVSFGDLNWTQIDFYYAINDIVDALIQENKDNKYFRASWSVETIGGIRADVATFLLEDGEATKGGSGGKSYYIKLPGDNIKTLIISKQSLGDKEFEDEFKHLVESINFLSK